MKLYDLIKQYGEGKGEGVMWKSVKVISDVMEDTLDEDEKKALMRKMYAEMEGGHYDEHFAKEDVACMYYVDESGQKQYAPYWSDEQVKAVYLNVRSQLPKQYGFWDFYVVMNMVKADHCPLLRQWFPGASMEEMTKRIADLSVAWLNDEDNPFGNEKIWRYLNP